MQTPIFIHFLLIYHFNFLDLLMGLLVLAIGLVFMKMIKRMKTGR